MSGTITAARTFIRINVPGIICERDRKIPWITVYGFDFTVCYQFDVQMPADLDQFR